MGFFSWWKDRNIVIKILLFIVPLIMGLLWVIGSFSKFDRLIMFMVGLVVGGILINIFLAPHITNIIEWFQGVWDAIFNS